MSIRLAQDQKEKAFLYIDILGFSELVKFHPEKIEKLFEIIDCLKVHKHFAFKTIVFSDTILVFNSEDSKFDGYYLDFLCEFVQDLFYHTIHHNIYFRAIITIGEFIYKRLNRIESYYGKALINCYLKEKEIKLIGLFIDKKIASELITFKTIDINKDFQLVILIKSFDSLCEISQGKLPIDYSNFEVTDQLARLDEDLLFFREVDYLRKHHKNASIRNKYRKTYRIYRTYYRKLIDKLEKTGFLPFIICSEFTGNLNPFRIIAQD